MKHNICISLITVACRPHPIRLLQRAVGARHLLAVTLVALSTMNAMAPALAGNNAPNGTSNTVSTSQNTNYTFQASDFGFSDSSDSPADSFTAVKITTLPAQGALVLAGTPVVTGQMVTVADISSGNLVYIPVTGASGVPYSSFTFQVQDDGTGNTNTATLLTDQAAIASSLNSSQTATAALPTVDYPDLTVTGTYLSGSNNWGTWQPSVSTVTSTLFGSSVTYPTRYLDEFGLNTPRNTTWVFQNNGVSVTAAELASSTTTYTYIFGVVGLGGEIGGSSAKFITSSVTLAVIGNGDAFGTDVYSMLDGQDTNIATNPNALGMTGTVISGNPNDISQGYTFFSLPAGASTITLTETGSDAGGIVFGVVATNLAATMDSTPKTLTIDVTVAGPGPVTQAASIPTLDSWGLLLLTLVMNVLGVVGWRGSSRRR